MEAAGNLAAAARPHQLDVLAGPDEPRSASAVAEVERPSKKQRMIAPLAKFIDWSVLQAGYAMLSPSVLRESTNERDLKLEQAVQFLNGPDFIPAESQPAQLDFGPDALGVRFRFPRRDHASSRKTMSFMAGYTVARTPGRKGRPSSSCTAPVTFPVISSDFTCSPAVITVNGVGLRSEPAIRMP